MRSVSRAGAQFGEFGDGTHQVRFVAVTPDEHRVVSSSYDGNVMLYDLESRQEIWCKRIWSSAVRRCAEIETLAVSKDGSRIASRDEMSGAIAIWNVESGDHICGPLSRHTHNVTGVSVLGSKDSVLSSSWDGSVRTWGILREQDETSFDGQSEVMGVSFTPDGMFV